MDGISFWGEKTQLSLGSPLQDQMIREMVHTLGDQIHKEFVKQLEEQNFKQVKDRCVDQMNQLVNSLELTGTEVKSIEPVPGKDGTFNVTVVPPPSMINFFLDNMDAKIVC